MIDVRQADTRQLMLGTDYRASHAHANHVSLAVGMLNDGYKLRGTLGPEFYPLLGGRHQPRLGVQFPLSMIQISPASSRALDLC